MRVTPDTARILSAQLEEAARAISAMMPRLGFVLVAFDFGSEGFTRYISNAKREDAIRVLKELIVNMEGN